MKWWIECGASLPNNKFVRNIFIRENEVNKFRFKYNNRGVFVTAYKYNDDRTLLLGDFYLDFDSTDLSLVLSDTIIAIQYMNRNFGIKPELVSIYFSGQKGIHIVVPSHIFGITASSDLNRVFRMIAEDISANTKHGTIDLKIYDGRRLFRLPNSVHPGSGLYKIPLTYEELKLTPDKILALAKEPRIVPKVEGNMVPMAQIAYQSYVKRLNAKKPRKTKALKPLSFTPPCIDTLLNQQVLSGQRNNSAAALISFFRQQGLDREEALQRVIEWNNRYCDPRMSDYELEATLDSIYKGEYKMGCTWLGSLSNCDKTNCKLHRRIR